MAGIYGPITEHPEFPITDERRFTVEIRSHEFERRVPARLDGYLPLALRPCALCGFERRHPIHPPLFEVVAIIEPKE